MKPQLFQVTENGETKSLCMACTNATGKGAVIGRSLGRGTCEGCGKSSGGAVLVFESVDEADAFGGINDVGKYYYPD